MLKTIKVNSCLILVFLGSMVIVACTILLGCANSIEPTTSTVSATLQPDEFQAINETMTPAPVGGESIVAYSKVLSVNDEVTGHVNVTGEWEVPGDSCTPWTFEAIDPTGNVIDSSTLMPDIITENPYYYFDFKASTEGKYIIKLIHYSLLGRTLTMVINPPGWQGEENTSA